MSNSPSLQASTLGVQPATTTTVLPSNAVNTIPVGSSWQQNKSLQFQDASLMDFEKRDALFHQVQLPQGVQTAQSVPHTHPQLLPVGHQGFQQGGTGRNQLLSTTSNVETFQSSATMTTMNAGAQSGTIALKPICIEQEPVSFRPNAITIEQPPLTIQPEAITIPQPPIVIHPEPIVIPQAPLVFQPAAVSLQRQAITFQPDSITMARPSYTVQPIIQYDTNSCAQFGEANFKQHVHIRLTNEQLMKQGLGSGNWVQTTAVGARSSSPVLAADRSFARSPTGEHAHAKFFSRDRDYNYGNPPSTSDKMKDSLGVRNDGPQHPVV